MERSIRFYDAALAPLGLERCNTDGEPDWDGWAGWGTYEAGGAKELALWVCCPFNAQAATAGNGTMVALRAKTWLEVEGFYKAALENGGRSEGPPGLRPQYNADFTRPMYMIQTETRLLLYAEVLRKLSRPHFSRYDELLSDPAGGGMISIAIRNDRCSHYRS